jgi:hypothetical protein
MNAMPAAYRKIVEPLIETARGIVERGESLSHMAFIGNLSTGETQIVPMVMPTDEAKDETAILLRHLAHLLQADFVFVIMDAWTLPRGKVDRYREIIAEYGSIGASPHRIDAVAFNLETRHGMWSAQVPLTLKGASKRRKTFGAPEFQLFDGVEGRFANLLPVKEADDQAAAGRLH